MSIIRARFWACVYLLACVGSALGLAGCDSPLNDRIVTKLATPAGALFCKIQTRGGGAFVATLTATALSGVAPAGGPVFVLATNAGRAAVDADCAKAALSVAGGVSGVPVSPLPQPVPSIAIAAPASPVVQPK